MSDTPLHLWADTIESAIASLAAPPVDRVAVLAETASTQDAARRMAANTPGLVVIADRQPAGRGRLGRAWLDDQGKCLVMTCALDARAHNPAFLALAAGVAIAGASASLLPADTLGLKWPNDLVERATARKIAGVLIETEGPLTLLGIGINANQSDEDWQRVGLTEAVSLSQLAGRAIDRLTLATRVLHSLADALTTPEPELIQAWRLRDTLTGTHQAFAHDGTVVSGLVESIDPTLTLVVRTREGLVRLPALTTSTAEHNTTRARSASEG